MNGKVFFGLLNVAGTNTDSVMHLFLNPIDSRNQMINLSHYRNMILMNLVVPLIRIWSLHSEVEKWSDITEANKQTPFIICQCKLQSNISTFLSRKRLSFEIKLVFREFLQLTTFCVGGNSPVFPNQPDINFWLNSPMVFLSKSWMISNQY